MTYVLLMLALLLFGVVMAVLGVILLSSLKNKVAGLIVLGVGVLSASLSILSFLFLVIATRTMG